MKLEKLKQACEQEIKTAIKIASKKYSQTFPMPTIEFSSKLTRTAGKAYLTQNRIKLSLPLLELNGERFVQDTPAHEMAHLIAWAVYRDCGHGPKWRSVMRAINKKPTRCHSFDVAPTSNTVTAKCSCRTHELGAVRARKMRLGTTSYACKDCKSTLVFATETRPTKPAPRKQKQKFSKADVVRKIITGFKRKNITLEQAQHDIHNIEFVMRTANLSRSLAKTYLANNWS